MRRLFFFCALFFSLTCVAAQTGRTQEWLAFQEQFKTLAAGPTGFYAAQDMQEINPGGTVHLPSAQTLAGIRWAKGTAPEALASVMAVAAWSTWQCQRALRRRR
jgi:hypothetical protein